MVDEVRLFVKVERYVRSGSLVLLKILFLITYKWRGIGAGGYIRWLLQICWVVFSKLTENHSAWLFISFGCYPLGAYLDVGGCLRIFVVPGT